jgi:predicted negative regulator of RcsB-dependent stress response
MDWMKFIEHYWKFLAGGFAALIVVGGVVGLVQNANSKKEAKAQEAYFMAERKLLDLRSKTENTTADVKVGSPDFGPVKKEFEKVMLENPGTVAAQMSAIHLSKILADEKNIDSALEVLQKAKSSGSELIDTLTQQQIALLMADKEKCTEAIQVWQKIIDKKSTTYLHDEARLQQALCYAKMNNLTKAEEILTNLASKSASPDQMSNGSAKEAEKYLKLIMFKKAAGT